VSPHARAVGHDPAAGLIAAVAVRSRELAALLATG
jgi:hypothetical protein